MVTVLLVVIYICFIGLGIPDSLFGTAWPSIYTEFSLPVSSANFVTVLISCGTITASLLSVKIIKRFGTGATTALSTALTAMALLGFSFSRNLVGLCAFAVPLGLGAGAIDSALNNYIAMHYKAVHMNFLHCFYGIGVSLSPYIMSLVLKNGNWRLGYRTAFVIQVCIATVAVLSLPLWKKVKHSASLEKEKTAEIKDVGFLTLAKDKRVRTVWLMFMSSCAVEATYGTWGSTYLVSSKGFNFSAAAVIVTCYYIGMAVGRFFSGLLSKKYTSWQLIYIGQAIMAIGFVILILPLRGTFAAVALFLIALGNAPLFPNLVQLTPENFGADISQSVMGTQMAVASAAIMILPAVFGFLAQGVGTWIFPYYGLLFYIIMVFAVFKMRRKEDAYNTDYTRRRL